MTWGCADLEVDGIAEIWNSIQSDLNIPPPHHLNAGVVGYRWPDWRLPSKAEPLQKKENADCREYG